MRLIGLSGYARTGKDTVGQVLATQGFERASFADTLRDFLYAVNPTVMVPQGEGIYSVPAMLQEVVEGMGWERVKDEIPAVRPLLQRTGTEAGRALLGDNVWVDATFRRLHSTGAYVFTDVRFPNEADAIRSRGGQVWRILRPEHGPVNDHPSEVALDGYDFDVTLVNNGTMELLRSNVIELLSLRSAA